MKDSHFNLEPMWIPDDEAIRRSNVCASMQMLSMRSYDEFHRWSTNCPNEFWQHVVEILRIKFQAPPTSISSQDGSCHKWFPGAKLNIAESCFNAAADSPAIISGSHDGELSTITYGTLYERARRIANGLKKLGLQQGDGVALFMPMNARSVEIYLGIILSGCTVVSIADSLVREQILLRLRIGYAKLIFATEFMQRGDKQIPLFDRIAGIDIPIIVVNDTDSRADASSFHNISWDKFISGEENAEVVRADPESPINILFSSGTTSEPKAIPWDHTTPIRAASDGYFHQDIRPGDVVVWPTSFGWMMGPWLTFAALINGGTIALFEGSPTTKEFGEFVEKARVNILGVVPSMISRWRQTGCMKSRDWSSIRLFSSTGECSNPADMRYLSQLAGGKPVIEYCGGTEIGGGYISSTVVQPNIPSSFSTPTLGTEFVILDENGQPSNIGEVYLHDAALGMSHRLLNADHQKTYYQDVPTGPHGEKLRRHGDQMERLPNGYYAAIGRADDTINIGGIKIGCAEIERVLATCERINEVAVIGVPPTGGGPNRLVACVGVGNEVLDKESFRNELQRMIRENLSPLFKLDDVCLFKFLPRTASNKILRRELREMYLQESVVQGAC